MRGSIGDLPYLMVALIFTVTSFWFVLKLMDAFNAEDTLPASARAVSQAVTNSAGLFDIMIVVATFVTAIAIMVLAFQYREHPAFFLVGILFLLALQFVYPIAANVLIAFATNAELSATANLFPLVLWLITNFPIVMLGIGGAVALVTYGKPASVGAEA